MFSALVAHQIYVTFLLTRALCILLRLLVGNEEPVVYEETNFILDGEAAQLEVGKYDRRFAHALYGGP